MVGSPAPSDANNQHRTSPAVRSSAGEKFLSNLPSRGLFSSSVISSNLGGMRVYVCEHDTSPPDDQLIKTDQTNILIRSLMIKKLKADSGSREGKGTAAESSRKRSAENALDGRSKRAMSAQNLSQSEGSKSRVPQKELQSLTVERLRALLKEKGLSLKGRKDDLIARLRAANE